MNYEHWYKLNNFTTNLFDDSFNLSNAITDVVKILPPSILSADVWAWFTARGLSPSSVILVFRPDIRAKSSIHFDAVIGQDPPITANSAINIEIRGHSDMIFYSNNVNCHFNFRPTPIPHFYTSIDSVTEIDRVTLDANAILVKINTTHTVDITEYPRTLISIRYSMGETHNPQWEQVVDALYNDIIPK